MFQSLRTSNLILRIALAIVFLWFGVDKFFHPDVWVSTWVPQAVMHIIAHIGMTGRNLIYLNGIFEVFVAISLLSGFFLRIFASAAIAFLLVVTGFNGINEIIVRDIGLMGALLALVVWPDRFT